MKPQVIIIGAGLAGLACARTLHALGVAVQVLEAAETVGGRIRTDHVDGFLLDRGFQVFLSSYPEPRRWLDRRKLNLRSFTSGARVRFEGRFYDLADPWRRPWTAVASLLSPIGSPMDKLRIARLRRLALRGHYEQRMHDPEQSTISFLEELGFSPVMIDGFLRPFFGGIFLDDSLQTSSRMLKFVFSMFSRGQACLPANGMQAIPEQIADGLPPTSIRLNTPVRSLSGQTVTLACGEQIHADHVVVAVDGPSAKRLLPQETIATAGRSVRCLYFAADQAPFDEPILVLNGEGAGPINNLAVLTNTTRSYSTNGQSLVSVTVLDETLADKDLESLVRDHLRDWYGQQVDAWRHVKTYSIPYALPDQRPPALDPPQRSVQLSDHLTICGDHRDNASIEGALASGRRAAKAVIAACTTQTLPKR